MLACRLPCWVCVFASRISCSQMSSMWHQTYKPAMQDALTRNLARQYAPHSVRVIGVNPAWVDTEAPAQMAAQLQVRPPPL